MIKHVHREPRQARDTKGSLEAYNIDALSNRGALLFSIIGGKMSEGINFADDLARCVVVVGLPYPDLSDPVLVEKMKSLDSIAAQQQKNRSNHADGPLPLGGRNYYKNLCMGAVNQSVGRAFRHADDYAAVILADYRYSSDLSVWNKLPNWLRNSREISRQHSYSKAVVELKKFFNEKKGSSV
jgi:chromosome transmission fidelity protein 1